MTKGEGGGVKAPQKKLFNWGMIIDIGSQKIKMSTVIHV